MTPNDAQNSAIPGAVPDHQLGEDMSEMWPNSRAKLSRGWEIRNRTYKKQRKIQ